MSLMENFGRDCSTYAWSPNLRMAIGPSRLHVTHQIGGPPKGIPELNEVAIGLLLVLIIIFLVPNIHWDGPGREGVSSTLAVCHGIQSHLFLHHAMDRLERLRAATCSNRCINFLIASSPSTPLTSSTVEDARPTQHNVISEFKVEDNSFASFDPSWNTTSVASSKISSG